MQPAMRKWRTQAALRNENACSINVRRWSIVHVPPKQPLQPSLSKLGIGVKSGDSDKGEWILENTCIVTFEMRGIRKDRAAILNT